MKHKLQEAQQELKASPELVNVDFEHGLSAALIAVCMGNLELGDLL